MLLVVAVVLGPEGVGPNAVLSSVTVQTNITGRMMGKITWENLVFSFSLPIIFVQTVRRAGGSQRPGTPWGSTPRAEASWGTGWVPLAGHRPRRTCRVAYLPFNDSSDVLVPATVGGVVDQARDEGSVLRPGAMHY